MAAALDNVLSQTHPASAVLVVVSPDVPRNSPTAKVLGRFGQHVGLVRANAPGLIPALNTGISMARTDFVAFLDSDDLWALGKQEQQIEQLLAQPSLHASTSKVANFRDEEGGRQEFLRVANSVLFTATTFRRGTFEMFGLVDPRATHHTWLYRWWNQAFRDGIRVENTGNLGVLRRIHSRNSWVTESDKAHRELLAELRRLIADKRDLPLPKSLSPGPSQVP